MILTTSAEHPDNLVHGQYTGLRNGIPAPLHLTALADGLVERERLLVRFHLPAIETRDTDLKACPSARAVRPSSNRMRCKPNQVGLSKPVRIQYLPQSCTSAQTSG